MVLEGDEPGPVLVILSGWACRYKILPDGGRQITAFLMPGDCFGLHASALDRAEHCLASLTTARVAMAPRRDFEALLESRPSILRAMLWTQLVDEDTLRAWIVAMGRRGSLERVAHLLCELFVRASAIGPVDPAHFELPLTQIVLGDALGLTPAHVNRVIRKLRSSGAIKATGRTLVVGDIDALARLADFDALYLHRRTRSRDVDQSLRRAPIAGGRSDYEPALASA